ncbi:MAG: alkaline phosphatase family protein [Verrucomicrobiaceae bacterium]|nr:MAG: alkaline phosphatase family protein [Verrucomicrobiaceae bacterium]
MKRALAALLILLAAGTTQAGNTPLERIAFGSCNNQDLPQPLWETIAAFNPQLWIWLGDNIYGDSEDMSVLAAKWDKQKSNPEYRKLTCPVTGTWDDHDFGVNDGGKDYPMKAASQRLFLKFLDVPPGDPRWSREGVYSAQTYGPPGEQVAVILLDVRTFRDKPGTDGDILGEAQWAWLEKTLAESRAQLHLIASGSQILPTEHRFEKWADYPRSRARLLSLLEKPTVLLTGDRHHAEISLLDSPNPVSEVTSSSLTHSISGNANESNALRVGTVFTENNFGTITIDWKSRDALLAIRDRSGRPALEKHITLPEVSGGRP